MIDVTVETFEAEVIAASMTTPVLVDFWAPWCGPCKTLGPLLEKMEEAYGGRFKLVKIDSDQEQQLAAAFGIRSIPTCVLLKNGQPVDGFMGAVPEGKLREFLDKHVPGENEVLAEAEVQEAEALMESGDLETAQTKLLEALQANPDAARADYDAGVKAGDFTRAHATVGEAVGLIADVPSAGALIARMSEQAVHALGRHIV